MRTMLGLFAEIERDLLRQRTKEGLEAARAKGKQLGRPKGTGSSKLDQYKIEIESMIKTGVQKKYIASKYKVAPGTLTAWLKKNKMQSLKPQITEI
jgi:DNA invertase Pin-like site-specific DNA recombinase